MRRAILVVALAWAAAGCAGRPLAPGAVVVEVQPRYRFGPASGSIQTPKGGAPGSTSPGRPTLEEIGAATAQEVGLEVRVAKGRHEVAADAGVLFLFGDSTLAEPLVSQERLFPAGTGVDSSTWIGLGRLAYRYALPFRLGGDAWCFRPGVGASLMHLSYALEGTNGATADRSYTHVAPHLEAGLAWRPGPSSPVWISADVRQTLTFLLPEDRRLDLFEGVVRAHYDVSRSWSVHLETGFRHVGFEDDQTVPNEVDVDFGPWIGVGITGRF